MIGKRYVICDIEATGLDADRDLIEIALITYQDDKVTDVYETLINPLRSIPEFITNLTSISNRNLKEAPKFYEVADAIRMRLEGAVFVSHNTEFDLGLLTSKYQQMGQDLKVKEFCTLKVSQNEIPGLSNYNLDALCSFFGIKIKERHRAIGDATATLELFKELQQLSFRNYSKPLYLPHHEKALKKISSKSGILYFKNTRGKVVRFESAFNMEKRARELLVIRPENKDLISKSSTVEAELTGLALIAEFKRLLFHPYKPKWVIIQILLNSGEMKFTMKPYRPGQEGLWYFDSYNDAKKKLKGLNRRLDDQKFAYREGGKSKEEILKNNQKIEELSKEAKLPSEHLIILGEGRTLGEKGFVLVRNFHVAGYGYSKASTEEIYRDPEAFVTRRISKHLGSDLATMNYLRVLKNLRHKTEAWRSLAQS